MSELATHAGADARAAMKTGRQRWTVVGLLFAATVINYVDRQMIGVLKVPMSHDLGWTERDFADIVFWFQVAYAIGYLCFGKVVDVLGARVGYAVAFAIWQLAHIAHGMVGGLTQFFVARFVLGLGESGNYPSAIKAVTDWFPARERAFAIGLFNAGANIGAIITPLLIPMIVAWAGWRAAFVVTGVAAFVWLALWLLLYRRPSEHPSLTSAELDWIRQDAAPPAEKIGFMTVLRYRQTYAYAAGRFLIDPIWWFFLFWLPGYLLERYGLNMLTFGIPLAAIYLISDGGSIAGGWFSSRLIGRGWNALAARKVTMLLCALAVLPIYFAQNLDNIVVAVLVIGLATAAHQAFSANLYALPADCVPSAAVGSVIGIGGTVGAVGGMLMAKVTGAVLSAYPNNYSILFAIAAFAYLAALAAIHVLTPRTI